MNKSRDNRQECRQAHKQASRKAYGTRKPADEQASLFGKGSIARAARKLRVGFQHLYRNNFKRGQILRRRYVILCLHYMYAYIHSMKTRLPTCHHAFL